MFGALFYLINIRFLIKFLACSSSIYKEGSNYLVWFAVFFLF